MQNAEFPLVSTLFITYRRFEVLQRTVHAFLRNTDYPKLELVIADDGSGPEIQARIRQLPAHHFALAPKNRGLGANNNAGLRLCTGKYVLMIQDDWPCYGPPEYLREAVSVMEANPDIGIINFSGSPNPPDLSMRLVGSSEPCYVTPQPYEDGIKPYYLYSDQPHLRSMECIRAIGFYRESAAVHRSEHDYELRWTAQTEFRTASFPAYYRTVFQQDESVSSLRTSSFGHRHAQSLVPVAHWLKQHCRPVYRASRACFYGIAFVLEEMRIVR